jgi:predicted nucleic acid-binding protein
MPLVFVDTWAWLALALRNDQHHEMAKKRHTEFVATGSKYVTTDYVLAELITQLHRNLPFEQADRFAAAVLTAIELQQYRLERVTPPRFDAAWQMRRRYSDKPAISFVDFTSFVVMRELGISLAFTGDVHFVQVNLGFQLVP